jgi:hypothetical protein
MSKSFLLVDFENVRDLALSRLSAEWCVRIFVGRSQNSIPFSLTEEAQKLGERLQWIKIQGDGRNNLDFHLAYYLGLLSAAHPSASFVILSRDHGFDALISHLVQRNIACRRIDSFSELIALPPDPQFARVWTVLSKIEKKSRPRKRKTLAQLISSVFQKKLPEPEIQRLVEELFAKGMVAESNNALTYPTEAVPRLPGSDVANRSRVV